MAIKKNQSLNSFSHLVSEISSDERKILLDKIQLMSGQIETQTLENPFAQYDDVNVSLSEDYKNEFILYKFWIWIRSIFKGVQPKDLYASDRVSRLATEVHQIIPGIMDYGHKCLTTLFYDHINQLKECAEFFKPYLSKVQGDIGGFYVFLGALVLPDITSMMNVEVDPFSTPPTETVTKEHRAALLRKMDEVLKSIPSISRNNMYKAVVSVEWLRQFVALPFNEFLSLFINLVSDSYVCSFDRLGSDFIDFVQVLCTGKTITTEALEAIFLFRNDKKDQAELDIFLKTAGTYLAILHGFISAVPLVSIARIVFNDYTWQSPSFGGAEDWFLKYKAEWKRNFDDRWEKWLFECKKEGQRSVLKNKFSLDSFPLLPDRPWHEIWGGLKFNYELTGGFICWYMEKLFSEHMKLLKLLQLEGDFAKSENKETLTSALNELDQVCMAEKDLQKSLKPDGESGVIFDRLTSEHMRTLKAQQKIDTLIAIAEQSVKDMKMNFGAALRKLMMVLKGVFNETEDNDYGSIRNLNGIGGKRNQSFVTDLHDLIQKFTDILEIISGIEILETESMRK